MAFAFPPGCNKNRDRAVFALAAKRALIDYHNRQTDPARRAWASDALKIVGFWASKYMQAEGAQDRDSLTLSDAIKAEALAQTKWQITDAMLEKIDYILDRAATLS